MWENAPTFNDLVSMIILKVQNLMEESSRTDDKLEGKFLNSNLGRDYGVYRGGQTNNIFHVSHGNSYGSDSLCYVVMAA